MTKTIRIGLIIGLLTLLVLAIVKMIVVAREMPKKPKTETVFVCEHEAKIKSIDTEVISCGLFSGCFVARFDDGTVDLVEIGSRVGEKKCLEGNYKKQEVAQ